MTTISRKIPKVLECIAEQSKNMIKMPETPQDLSDAKSSFFAIAGFPGVIGVIGIIVTIKLFIDYQIVHRFYNLTNLLNIL